MKGHMKLRVAPLAKSDVPEALSLLAAAYGEEKTASPLLPSQMLGDNRKVMPLIERCIQHGCVAAFSDGRMVGFMGIYAIFRFKGQLAALVREVSHAALGSERAMVCQSLYEALGESLRARRAQLHIVAHFAGDRLLRDALYQLGFGAFLTERLRDLSPIAGAAKVAVVQEKDFLAIEDLEIEHMRYYRSSPILLMKDDSSEVVRSRLLQRQAKGDTLFVYCEGGVPAAYFMVGACAGESEGLLLRDTRTAQLLSAYAKPHARGKGIGKALLDHSVAWARERGYTRLFVEHESANLIGGAFWSRHFAPYLFYSMRYVEDCGPQAGGA